MEKNNSNIFNAVKNSGSNSQEIQNGLTSPKSVLSPPPSRGMTIPKTALNPPKKK